MKILLLGKNGQVGWELQRSLAPIGELIALDRTDAAPTCGDLSRPELLAATVRHLQPDVIVNAAAYTTVDKAESEPDLARTINAASPGALARAAAVTGALLIHFSTDYVFDGSGSAPWMEADPTGPLNAYGRTKLEGEQLVRESGCRHLILRTSWVYAARGNNFPRTMLRLAFQRDALSVVDDQYGAPTSAELIADVTTHALCVARAVPGLAGTYHLAAAGETTWHGYAQHLIGFARTVGAPVSVAQDAIRPISASAFPTPAKRPANSRLDTRKLRSTFDLNLPDWKAGVDRTLAELLQK